MPLNSVGSESEDTLVHAAAMMINTVDLMNKLGSLGLQTTGRKTELADRLATAFKAEDVLGMLNGKRLRRLGKDFDLPPLPPKSGWMPESEKSRWVKHLAKFALKVRPRETIASPASVLAEGVDFVDVPVLSRAAPAAPPATPVITVSSRSVTKPSLAEVLAFVEKYTMEIRWWRKQEESYQAELFGALRVKFPDARVRVELAPGGGKRYDIVVGETRIEVKLPKRPKALEDMQGQIEKYVEDGKPLIAVVVEHHVTDHIGAGLECEKLEAKGAKVVRKR